MGVKTRNLVAALLLVTLPGLLFAQEQDAASAGADAVSGLSAPVQIDALATPLSGANSLPSGPASLGATALPASALNAALSQNAAVLPPPKSAISVAPQAGISNGAVQPADAMAATQEPYFAKALARLGVDPVLAGRLAAASREPSSEKSAASGQTPDLAAAVVLGHAGARLSPREKIAVIAAAIAAAHPEFEPRHAALLSELEAQTGVDRKDVAALVRAACLNPKSADSQDAGSQPQAQDWTSSWGQHLAFASKTAAAARAVLRPKSLADAVRAENALNALRQAPEFAIFPSSVRHGVQAVLSRALEQRRGPAHAPLNESARAQAPPNPAQAAALAQARGEAANLGLPAEPQAARAAANPLSALKNDGFAILSPQDVPDFFLESRILAAIEKHRTENASSSFWQWPFMEEGGRWRTDKRQTPELVADVRRFAEALTAELQDALPDENIQMRDVQIRVDPPPQTGAKLHVDGGYITATCALSGPGTVIYDDSGGRVRRLQAPQGAVAFVSNLDREFARNIPGAVHAAPTTETAGRVILIIRYKRLGQEPASSDQRLRQNDRNARRIKAVEKSGL